MADFVSEINLVLASLSFCLSDIDKDFIRTITLLGSHSDPGKWQMQVYILTFSYIISRKKWDKNFLINTSHIISYLLSIIISYFVAQRLTLLNAKDSIQVSIHLYSNTVRNSQGHEVKHCEASLPTSVDLNVKFYVFPEMFW